MIHVFKLKTITILLLSIALFMPIITQAQSEQCTAILEQSLSVLSDTCNAIGDNQGCYATGEIPDALTDTAQAFDLSTTSQIATSPLSLENNDIGSALLKVQNADQSVYVFLLGETTVNNSGEDDQLAYQDIFLTTTSSIEGCQMLDAFVAVFAPVEEPIALTINGEAMTFQGLMTVHWLNANSLEIVVHQGTLAIADASTLDPNLTISAITNAGQVIAWSAPYPSDAEQMQRGNLIANTVNTMLNTSVEVVEVTEPVDVVEATPEAPACEDQIHTVSSGETLYRISLRYGVSQNSIIAANQIANPDVISVGQQLVIPCASDQTTTTTAPIVNNNNTNNNTNTQEPAPEIIDNDMTTDENALFCSNFFANAPIGGYPPQIISLYNQLCP